MFVAKNVSSLAGFVRSFSLPHAYRLAIGFCAIMGVFMQAWPSDATSVLALSEEKIVEQSTVFVRGTVESQRCVWGPRGIGIVTLVKLKVAKEILDRGAPAYVTIRHFGGQIGETKVQMPGGPSFTDGEEVVVALQSSPYLPADEYLLIGLTQSIWRIKEQKKDENAQRIDSKRIIYRTMLQLHLVQTAPTPTKTQPPPPLQETLSSFIARMRKHWHYIQALRKHQILPLQPTIAAHPIPRIELKKPLLFTPLTPKPAQVETPNSTRPQTTKKP